MDIGNALRKLKIRTWSMPLLSLALGIVTSFGQEKSVSHANQQWVQYYTQTRLTDQWTLLGDASYRWKDGFDTRTQYLLRIGITYKTIQNLQLGTGIAHLGNYGPDGLERVEFRPYQDLGLKNEFVHWALSQRIRIEERFFNPVEEGKIKSPNGFNFRFRYAITASIPLFHLSAQHPERTFLLYLGDEIFLNAGNEIVTNVFDQNRILISPTLQWNKKLAFALTWSYQDASGAEAGTFVHTDVFWLQIRQQLDARPKATVP